ncbi:MAG: GDSL-type esterase/lipase family protein [Bacteroidales bacterium]|nr:GDSL-type esterase/lipase family protein [Bacteroidales bacterium]
MKPVRIFGFGLCVITVIFIISSVFPADGWKIMGTTVHFPSLSQWWQLELPGYKDIREIISSVSVVEETDSVLFPADTTAAGRAAGTEKDTLACNDHATGEGKACLYPFVFPEGKDTLMYSFFRYARAGGDRRQPVRILHYGDSQIESDRITSTIRDYMQKKFGGMGRGYIPAVPASDISRSFQQDVPAQWVRFSVQDRKKDSITHGYYGIAGAFARYMATDAADTVTHIGLMPVGFGYRLSRSFTHVGFFYGNSRCPVSVSINRSDTKSLRPVPLLSSVCWEFDCPQQSLHLSLSSRSLPDVYGITLDGASGVAVDNIPLRGSAGMEFTKIDRDMLGQMFAMMNVKALILQFGANAVAKYNGNGDYYAKLMERQIRTLQSLSPDLLIIVVGAGDMSQHSPDGYVTHSGVADIREAQRKTALQCGCVFWDLFEAMGGENSMPSWVLADPPLANKDFVHFTLTGAKIVGELFCRAWAAEYRKFLRKEQIPLAGGNK